MEENNRQRNKIPKGNMCNEYRASLESLFKGKPGPQSVLTSINDDVLIKLIERAECLGDAAKVLEIWWQERREKLINRLHLDKAQESLWPADLIKITEEILIEQYAKLQAGEKNRDKNLKPHVKKWNQLESTTKATYLRDLDLITKRTGGNLNPLDVACLLVDVAQNYSRSRYYMQRAAIRKVTEGNKTILEILKLLPSYPELRRRIGAPYRPRTGPITHRRRTEKDMETLQRLLARLPEGHREIMLAIILSGARRSEIASLQIGLTAFKGDDVIKVTIENRKTGCRVKNRKQVRTLIVDPQSWAGRYWLDILNRIGPEPFVHTRQSALETTWRRARQKEGVHQDQAWCLHALRHNFSAELKRKLPATPSHRKTIAAAMGHGSYDQAKVYGRAGSAVGIDIGILAAW